MLVKKDIPTFSRNIIRAFSKIKAFNYYGKHPDEGMEMVKKY